MEKVCVECLSCLLMSRMSRITWKVTNPFERDVVTSLWAFVQACFPFATATTDPQDAVSSDDRERIYIL